MGFKLSLIHRIILVFALMSALVAGIFSVGIVVTVHAVEKRLITLGLGGNLHRLLLMDNAADWPHHPEKDEFFFAQGATGDLELPPDLKRLHSGFGEINREEKRYYYIVKKVDGRKYVLLRDQAGFEQREHLLFTVVFCGLLLSIALSVLLGWLLARRVMAPVIRLARQVRHRDQMMSAAPPLASDYARDEVGELALSFDGALGRLRDALWREKLFTSDVSHELRTPLMVLASSCELLLADPNLDPRSHAQVTRIARASHGMQVLVETFLLLARSSGDQASNGPLTTLRMVADEQVETWRQPMQEKGLELQFVPCDTSPIQWNATFLHSVMGNLLRNAWHYTDSGFIRLTLQPDGFTVEDSGIGIPKEQQAQMFQPFVRGDEQRGEGLGLGLSLVQRICTSQNWTVQLSSLEPHGCCFRVELQPQAALAGQG